MKHLLAFFIVVAILPTYGLTLNGPRLISYKLHSTVNRDSLSAKMRSNHVPKGLLNPKYDVDVYDIDYVTCWHDSTCIKASGLYYVPRNAEKPMANIVYHHGTRVSKGRRNHLGGEEQICVGYATDGYAVLQPDYIGLGRGDKFHLYQNAESLGQATADMLFAIQELDSALNLKKSEQLFLTGYSEGGYAALAAHKFLQEKLPNTFKVTATSANSGAYDMAGVQSTTMFKEYDHPHYLPYLLMGMNEVYKMLPYDISRVYKAPYDSLIPIMFSGKSDFKAIDKLLPKIPKDMLLDTFVQEFQTNPDFPLKKILNENSLINWVPTSPVQMCYCDKDEQVTYKNALVAEKRMKELGAKHVYARRSARKYGHNKCALFASMYSKLYFDSFRNGSIYGRKGNVNKRFLLSLAKLAIKP